MDTNKTNTAGSGSSGSDSSDSGSSGSDSSGSDSDSDDPNDGFTTEQREAISKRLAALRGNFKVAEEASIDQKVHELMNSVQAITREQALMALQVCNNNEFQAAERLETEPGFRDSIANMVIGVQPKKKRSRAVRAPSVRNTITQVQVNGEGGAVVRRNMSGKGVQMPNSVIFFDVPDEITDEGIRTFCEKYGTINVLEFQRVRLRVVCSYVDAASADKVCTDNETGTAAVDGFLLRLKRKVKKNNRVGRVLLDDALQALAEMEKQEGGVAAAAAEYVASSSSSSSSSGKKKTPSKKTKTSKTSKKTEDTRLAEFVAVGSVIEVKTRDSPKDRLKWHRANVLRVEVRGKVRTRLVAIVIYTSSGNRDEYDVELEREGSVWRLLSGGKTTIQVQSERRARGEEDGKEEKVQPKTPEDGSKSSRKRARDKVASSSKKKQKKQSPNTSKSTASTSSSSSATTATTATTSATGTDTTTTAAKQPKKGRATGMTECLKSDKGKMLLGMGWSEARVKAYMNKDNNPNAYYYRFNDVGEVQGKGKFSVDEKKRFKELISKGVNYRWGMFSMEFPGRVGYQCSNFYRQLVTSGEIVDPNYVVDAVTGKLTFKRLGTGKRKGSTTVKVGEDRQPVPRAPPKPRARAPPKPKMPRKKKIKVKPDIPRKKFKGPETLVGFRDPMTGDKVDDLAISPFGHIMSYESWIKVLQPSFQEKEEDHDAAIKKKVNTCPFTGQKLSRRELVRINKNNIEEYREKIKNGPK